MPPTRINLPLLAAGMLCAASLFAQAPQGPVQRATYESPLPIPRKTEAPLPLAPRGQEISGETPSSGDAVMTTLGSLAVVLCLFLAVTWLLKRGAPTASTVLPGEVVEILGRAPLPGRHQMHLVRCGHKLLLVAISTAGADTLTEITDPVEVDRLCGLCREHHPQSATASFRSILNQLGNEPRKGRQPRQIEEDDA
jgi:flagellar biogenesis protein FliO